MITILRSGMCTCDTAPMGHGGLEGFDEKRQYFYEHCSDGDTIWYRVYHDTVDVSRETCSVGIFKKHFKLQQNGTDSQT